MNPPTEAAAATPGELKSGTTLDGRFEIIRLLNRGGMACVYLATDRENARTVNATRSPTPASNARRRSAGGSAILTF